MYLEEISHTTGVTLFLCAFAMLLLVLHGRRREPGCSLPPGPRPWPLVGNLFQMGEQIHLSLTNLRVQYGDVFQIKMGSLVVVVLSGYSTIKEALIRQGEAFAGRPDFFTFSAVANGTSMTFSEKYGEAWVLHKKICRKRPEDLLPSWVPGLKCFLSFGGTYLCRGRGYGGGSEETRRWGWRFRARPS